MSIKTVVFDSSTSSTGVAVFVNGKYINHLLIKTDKETEGDDKLSQMIKLVYEHIDKEKPDIVLTEKAIVMRNAQTQNMLTELLGAIRGKCINNNIFYYCLRPAEWRSIITKKYNRKPKGRKRADQKEWSLDIVNNVLGIETDSDDCSDSILLGISYIEMFT